MDEIFTYLKEGIKYDFDELALYGITYQKNKKIITIEFHLGKMNINSIVTINNKFKKILQDMTKNEISQAIQIFNTLINSKFYIIIPMYRIDNQICTYTIEKYFFSKDQTSTTIKNWIKQNINQFLI